MLALDNLWMAALIAGALAAAWWIVDGKTLFICPLISRYLDFRFWLTERRLWIRETRRWASTLTGELSFVAQATSAVLRHHLSTRPRYGGPEWKEYRESLRQRVDLANNKWRDGKPSVQPVPYVAPWRRSYSCFTRENPPPLGGT